MRIFTVALIFLSLTGPQRIYAQPLAFPGAEGWGKHTIGGRGGVVHEVTNLNDSGPGSLRAAVSAYGPRTVIFRVSGTIQLKSDLEIKYPNITIAGQTAPGEGICLRDQAFEVSANQVVIRYLRFRLGDTSATEDDAIWGRYRKNIIIDHCSASWSVDEGLSFYANDSLTIQWCIISESLYLSTHPKGAHGYGGIWGGRNVTFHHNLLAHHSSRNPRFSGGETAACENVDFRNNVIYNWGFNSGYGGEGGTINMVANFYQAGPATKSGVRFRIIQPTDGKGKWFVEENHIVGSPAITANNWAGGVQGSFAAEAVSRAYTPFPSISIIQQNAVDARVLVLQGAGANLPKRDAVDERIIQDVSTGTATCDGRFYEKIQNFSDTTVVRGIIDSQNDAGGWPTLVSLTAPVDSDHDGMPDEWELGEGLDPNNNADRNLINGEGYTMLEVYLNSLVSPTPAHMEPERVGAVDFTLQQNYPNPFNPKTTILYTIPAAGRVSAVIFDFSGRVVKNFPPAYHQPGNGSIEWDGRDEQGRTVASGIYFCAVHFYGRCQIVKMQLIR